MPSSVGLLLRRLIIFTKNGLESFLVDFRNRLSAAGLRDTAKTDAHHEGRARGG